MSETSPGSIQGVPGELPLSPSCDGASWQVCRTFRQTNSDAQDVDVSRQRARLSFVGTRTPCQRPAPDELDVQEERKSMHLEQRGSVFTQHPMRCNPYAILFEMYCLYSSTYVQELQAKAPPMRHQRTRIHPPDESGGFLLGLCNP